MTIQVPWYSEYCKVIHHLSFSAVLPEVSTIYQRVSSLVMMGIHLDIPGWHYLVNHINSVTVNNVVLNATVIPLDRFAIFYCTER